MTRAVHDWSVFSKEPDLLPITDCAAIHSRSSRAVARSTHLAPGCRRNSPSPGWRDLGWGITSGAFGRREALSLEDGCGWPEQSKRSIPQAATDRKVLRHAL